MYRGINLFLLSMLPFESPFYLTYKQCKEKGGKVKKGKKGFPVVFYKWIEKNDVNTQTGEIAEKKTPYLRYYTVFNTEQCEGLEVELPEKPELKEHDKIQACEAVVHSYINHPEISEQYTTKAAYYPGQDKIVIPEIGQYENREEYYSTLFHEMVHSTGHLSRLNREGVTGSNFFGDKTYSKEELIAEMGASYLCAHAGIENTTIENSTSYLSHWLDSLRNDKRVLIHAGQAAQKAVDWIFGEVKTVSI